MPELTFKDLVIDVTDEGDLPARVAAYWAVALGQTATAVSGPPPGLQRLDPGPGQPEERRIWVVPVPEAATGKSRVHLDVRSADGDPAPLEAVGGTVVRRPDGEVAWHVVDDPGGVPMCLMGPHPMAPDAPGGPFELVVDAADPERIAAWWAERTGGTVQRREGMPHAWIEGAAGFPFLFWVFAPVPEPKTVKNRVHWDVLLTGTTVDELVAAGATVLRRPDDEVRWTVLADPEGNEFCAFAE